MRQYFMSEETFSVQGKMFLIHSTNVIGSRGQDHKPNQFRREVL